MRQPLRRSFAKPMYKYTSSFRIAFVHNMYISYRIPLFQILGKIFNITYFFDNADPKTRIKDVQFRFKVLNSVDFLKSQLYTSTLSPTLFYHLLRGRYDIIIGADIGHIGTYIAFLVSRLTRKPFILSNEIWYWPRTFRRVMIWPFVKLMLKKSSAIVVHGTKAKEFLLSFHVDPDKIFVAPNASICVPDKNIIVKKEKLKKRLRIHDKKIVLYLGRLMPVKGLLYLIEAFSKLQKEMVDAFLLIVGDGELRNELEELCLEYNINHAFLPATYDEGRKALYYSLAEVFVLPSVNTGRDVEVWGLVLNEAMSVGKPVIATTAVGAAYDLIENGINGYIINQRDVQGLYEALRKILLDPAKLDEMGMMSKKIIEKNFTYDNMAQGFIKSIRYVLNSSKVTKR